MRLAPASSSTQAYRSCDLYMTLQITTHHDLVPISARPATFAQTSPSPGVSFRPRWTPASRSARCSACASRSTSASAAPHDPAAQCSMTFPGDLRAVARCRCAWPSASPSNRWRSSRCCCCFAGRRGRWPTSMPRASSPGRRDARWRYFTAHGMVPMLLPRCWLRGLPRGPRSSPARRLRPRPSARICARRPVDEHPLRRYFDEPRRAGRRRYRGGPRRPRPARRSSCARGAST